MEVEVGFSDDFYETFDDVYQVIYENNRVILKFLPDDGIEDHIFHLDCVNYVIIDH